MSIDPENEAHLSGLLQNARAGDEKAGSDLINSYRARIRRMIDLRMDRRLNSRLDASDVVQETMLEANRRLSEYFQNPPTELFVWIRWIANDKLVDAHRFHLGAQKRDVGQEISIHRRTVAEATSYALAEHLLGRFASPSEAIRQVEVQAAIESAINRMEPVDREVLVMRHFENLTNKEVAESLGLTKSGASRRYIAAVKRLKEQLQDIPLFEDYY